MATANNPFDLGTKSTNDLLTSATSGIVSPDATGYNAASAGSQGYNAANAGAQGYNASNANAQGYNATTAAGTNWNVNSNQTVQNQLQGIIAANSPLMQQARTNALQQMNQRGLTNSSMAIGAGQNAVIAQALPIAQQDAQTYSRSGEFNANVANQMAQFNAGQENTARQFGASAANQASLANQAAQNTASQFGASASNQAALANQAAQNTASQFGASAANQAALANQSASNQAAQFSAAASNTASQQYAQSLNATVNKMMDQSMQIALANADAETKIQLQNIDATTRKDLAATEAAYKNQMQASASSNEIFQQVTKNISDIMANPDLDAAAKQSAVNTQKTYLQNAMTILSATSGIPGLKNLITIT